MFHNKIKIILILSVLFTNNLFSQISNIRTLQLDFYRTETLESGEITKMTGSIYYQSSPSFFVFETQEPYKQIAFSNTDGTFLQEAEVLYDYSDGEYVLEQTCTDILTWFKSDCDLKAQGYFPIKTQMESDFLVTEWVYTKAGIHPFEKILVYSDSNNRFRKLQMFTQNDKLFVETTLDNFGNYNGLFYPTKITSVSFNEDEIFSTTTLIFSKVQINKSIEQKWNGLALEVKPAVQKGKINYSYIKAKSPQIEKFTASPFMMVVNGSYSFYKKFITKQDNSACPFEPTCSQYMLDAVSKYGPWGVIMGVERLRRCTKFEHSQNLYPVTNNGRHLDPVR